MLSLQTRIIENQKVIYCIGLSKFLILVSLFFVKSRENCIQICLEYHSALCIKLLDPIFYTFSYHSSIVNLLTKEEEIKLKCASRFS